MSGRPSWVERVEAIRASAVARRLFYGVLFLLVLVDLLVPKGEERLFWGLELPGFAAVYGLISCVLIIVVSKWLGHAGLMKAEEYYD